MREVRDCKDAGLRFRHEILAAHVQYHQQQIVQMTVRQHALPLQTNRVKKVRQSIQGL
jgi:hypothetical protein